MLARRVGLLALLSLVLWGLGLPWLRLLVLRRGMLSLVGLTGMRGLLTSRMRLRAPMVLALRRWS